MRLLLEGARFLVLALQLRLAFAIASSLDMTHIGETRVILHGHLRILPERRILQVHICFHFFDEYKVVVVDAIFLGVIFDQRIDASHSI